MKDSAKRSILKTIAWRLVATLTTTLVAYLFTGKLLVALEIGSVEAIAKIVLYYFHERVWERIGWGRHPLSTITVRAELTEEDLRIIEEKLRELGYL